jgi:hypothetical protein
VEFEQSLFKDPEAILATVARLFAKDGDQLAVEVLSSAKPRFEWYSHDNWDGGFDIYNLYLAVTLPLFSRLEKVKAALELKILDRIQAVSAGHTADHVRAVSILLEVTGGDGWREGAQAWALGGKRAIVREDNRLTASSPLIRSEIFTVPTRGLDEGQVAVMMPFKAEFDKTYEALKRACSTIGLSAVRADDIWRNNTFLQDIFELIYCSKVVVVDFSERNSNVMYETGIAHTLGRKVIPITRDLKDIPSDLGSYRALKYLPNMEGLAELEKQLAIRLSSVTGREPKPRA